MDDVGAMPRPPSLWTRRCPWGDGSAYDDDDDDDIIDMCDADAMPLLDRLSELTWMSFDPDDLRRRVVVGGICVFVWM